jgi:hypothetical protein
VQDADDGSVRGENADSNRGGNGGQENYGHNQRIHGTQPFNEALISDARPGNPYT